MRSQNKYYDGPKLLRTTFNQAMTGFYFANHNVLELKRQNKKTIAKYLRQSTEALHLNLNNSIDQREFKVGQGILTALKKKGHFRHFLN